MTMASLESTLLSRRELARRVRWLVLGYGAFIAGYASVGRYAATLPARDLSLPIDALIPFVPEWVFVYELTYALPLLAIFAIADRRRFDRTLVAMLVASVGAYAIFIGFPIGFERPALGSSLAERVLAFEYRHDFPPLGANHLPSLHVANAFILYLGVRGQRLGRWGDRLALVLAIAIAASTLLVKQHIVLDVVTGLLWAPLAHALAGRMVVPDRYPRMPGRISPTLDRS
jgi:membrane-associated phospholipid phosphatase